MGKLRRIESLINEVAPLHTNIHLLPRGIPYYIDAGLKGKARFARKIGNEFGLLNPDVTVRASRNVRFKEFELHVDRMLTWYDLNCIIAFGDEREYGLVTDFYSEKEDNILLLRDYVNGNYDLGTEINLYATRVPVLTNITKGDTEIYVRSKYDLMIGDQFLFLTDENINTKIVIDVADVEFISTNSDAWIYPNIYNYKIILKNPVPYSYNALTTSGGDYVYLRANPAYSSQQIPIPYVPDSVTSIGPFLADYISGRLDDGKKVEEFMSLAYYNIDNEPMQNKPFEAYKNYSVTNLEIPSDAFLFFNKLNGRMSYENRKFVAICDENGYFGMTSELFPEWIPAQKWDVVIKANENAKLRVKLYPNEYVDYNLLKDVNNEITLGYGFQQSANKIEIAIISEPNAKFYFGNLQPDNLRIFYIKCYLLGRVYGLANWQFSSLILKPYFLSLDYLKARFDLNRKYDSGLIYDGKGF